MNLLQAEEVCKTYGTKRVLDHVSINVEQGKVYGLLGPNGAGKTTLIRIINHITAPDEGRVIFDGHELTAADVVNIGYLPEERGLYKKMKVGEQAVFFARLKGLSRTEATGRLKEWFERFGIMSWWDKKVEELSKGMAQKVQFIVTVLHRPKLLIFDEPFSGFDPINANLLRDEILRLKDEGATVIFSTHNMASVEEVCDNITLINGGKNILTGDVQQLRSEYARGRYTVTYAPDTDILEVMRKLEPLASNFMPETDKRGRHVIGLKLTPGTKLHELFTAANAAGDLRGVNEAEASMNEIFINAVEQSENKLKSVEL